jgi:hypothetical protein
MKRLLLTLLILMTFASVAMAGGHTDKADPKVAETVESDIQQIIKLPARLAVAAWIALSPAQRQEILHYITPQERAVILDDFESILKIDGLKP